MKNRSEVSIERARKKYRSGVIDAIELLRLLVEAGRADSEADRLRRKVERILDDEPSKRCDDQLVGV